MRPLKRVPKPVLRRLREISAAAESLGLEPYLVGGLVRDLVLKVPFKQDVDVTVCGGDVEPLAKGLAKKWKARCIGYPRFLTFTLEFLRGPAIDLVTARQESYPQPAVLPDVRTGTLETDLLRRDFSINAMVIALSKKGWGVMLDPLGGLKDLQNGHLRVLHGQSFTDDPTRIFRAARFCGRFGFRLEGETEKQLTQAVKDRNIHFLSADRIRNELELILNEKNPGAALLWLSRWGALEQAAPRLQWNLDALSGAAKVKSLAARLAMGVSGNPRGTVEDFLSKFNWPRETREAVLAMASLERACLEHKPVTQLEASALSMDAAEFFKAQLSSRRDPAAKKWCKEYLSWSRSRPALGGEDLKRMGFPPGPLFKEILRALALARYQKKVKTRAQEERFVVDNYRRG